MLMSARQTARRIRCFRKIAEAAWSLSKVGMSCAAAAGLLLAGSANLQKEKEPNAAA